MGETTVIITLVIFNLIFIAFIGGIVIFIRQFKIKRSEHENELVMREEQHKQELLQTQVEIQNQTMAQIGREIHDNVGQKLTLASLYAKKI